MSTHASNPICYKERSNKDSNHMTWQSPDMTITWHDNHLTWQSADMTISWHDNHLTWQSPDMTITWHDNHLTWQSPDMTITWHDHEKTSPNTQCTTLTHVRYPTNELWTYVSKSLVVGVYHTSSNGKCYYVRWISLLQKALQLQKKYTWLENYCNPSASNKIKRAEV